MKKLLVALAVVSLTAIASADPVPAPLQKSLASFQVKSVDLSDGNLRVITSRNIVSGEVYRNVISNGACLPLWLSAQGWGDARIDRIEVRNSNATQGFEMQGGRAECEELAKVSGPDSVKTYIEERTFVCLAGNECRARRPGETTAGD